MKKASKITGTLCLLAASMTLASAAHAQSNYSGNTSGNYAYNANKTYFGLSAGKSDFTAGNNNNGIFSTDQNDSAYRINLGSYFNPNWGADLAYTDFGKVSRAGGSTKADAWSLAAVGKFPMSTSVNFLGKIGASFGRTTVTATPASGLATGDSTGVGVLFGLGLEFVMTPQWSALLEYDSHNMKFAGERYDRVGLATVGVRYGF